MRHHPTDRAFHSGRQLGMDWGYTDGYLAGFCWGSVTTTGMVLAFLLAGPLLALPVALFALFAGSCFSTRSSPPLE